MQLNRLHDLAISDSGFIFNPSTGNSYTTNETGVFIITMLKKHNDIATTALLLSEEYDVDQSTAELDIYSLLEMLRSHELI